METALVGQPLNSATLAAAAAAVTNDLDPDDILGDIHAGADYRQQMASVFVRRALEAAVSRAG